MGGIGSGSWVRQNAKQPADELCALDVNKMVRSNLLRPGTVGTITWAVNGNAIERVSFRVRSDGFGDLILWVEYRWKGNTMTSPGIHLESTVPHFSGVRWYFSCPMSSKRGKCERRAAKLYLHNGQFGCRHCHDLTYLSCQQSHQLGRLSDRLEKLVGLPPARDWERFRRRFAEIRNG